MQWAHIISSYPSIRPTIIASFHSTYVSYRILREDIGRGHDERLVSNSVGEMVGDPPFGAEVDVVVGKPRRGVVGADFAVENHPWSQGHTQEQGCDDALPGVHGDGDADSE